MALSLLNQNLSDAINLIIEIACTISCNIVICLSPIKVAFSNTLYSILVNKYARGEVIRIVESPTKAEVPIGQDQERPRKRTLQTQTYPSIGKYMHIQQ